MSWEAVPVSFVRNVCLPFVYRTIAAAVSFHLLVSGTRVSSAKPSLCATRPPTSFAPLTTVSVPERFPADVSRVTWMPSEAGQATRRVPFGAAAVAVRVHSRVLL